ncbi:MAG TPA: hypothetical protein VK502_03365 [Candidatus Saccharimonadales bacterium]|nr:hypothetical protein [Candidatus Saccharimonadales bacterium]
MGKSEAEQARERLFQAIEGMSDGVLWEVVAFAETAGGWEASLAKAKQLARQPHRERSGSETVTHADFIAFTNKIGIPLQRASRIWGDFVRRHTSSGTAKELQNTLLTIDDLRRRPGRQPALSKSARQLLEVWLMNL